MPNRPESATCESINIRSPPNDLPPSYQEIAVNLTPFTCPLTPASNTLPVDVKASYEEWIHAHKIKKNSCETNQ